MKQLTITLTDEQEAAFTFYHLDPTVGFTQYLDSTVRNALAGQLADANSKLPLIPADKQQLAIQTFVSIIATEHDKLVPPVLVDDDANVLTPPVLPVESTIFNKIKQAVVNYFSV